MPITQSQAFQLSGFKINPKTNAGIKAIKK